MREDNNIPQRQQRQLRLFCESRSRHGEPYQKLLLVMLARAVKTQAQIEIKTRQLSGKTR